MGASHSRLSESGERSRLGMQLSGPQCASGSQLGPPSVTRNTYVGRLPESRSLGKSALSAPATGVPPRGVRRLIEYIRSLSTGPTCPLTAKLTASPGDKCKISSPGLHVESSVGKSNAP